MYACVRHLWPTGFTSGTADTRIMWSNLTFVMDKSDVSVFVMSCVGRILAAAELLYKEPYKMYINTILTCAKREAVDQTGQMRYTRENMQL
jgi:hypothetical protein